MTQTSLLTRCPHCETRFRVTDAQLGVAKGKVRCGNCMQVFNAREHQIGEFERPRTPTLTPEPPSRDSPDAPASSEEDDFIFQDNPDEDASEGRYAGSPRGFSEDELSDSFRGQGQSRDDKGFAVDIDDDGSEPVDESWAEAILEDETPAPSRPAPSSPPPSSPAEDSLRASPTTDRSDWQETGNHDASADVTSWDSDQSLRATRDDDLALVADAAVPEQPESPQRAATPYQDLGREPVAIGGGGGGLRRWFWSVLVLALILGLVSQVVYFQFDRLSSIPELRPYYEQACEIAGCELEPLVAMDRIESRKLVVRTDPDDRNALIVDAVIINQADFQQPFPAIALTFSNLNGDVVAQSVFAPEDYLAGDGQDLSAMPPDTPVRIAINIRDPGRDAVNYNIRFLSQE